MGIDNEEIKPCEPVPVRLPFNDSGNAADFIERFKDRVRYVPEWKCWLVWDGKRWHRDNVAGSRINRLADEHAKTLLREASEDDNESTRGASIKRATQLGQAGKRESMLSLARHDLRIQISQLVIDADPLLIGVANGVVNLVTGKLLPPDPTRYVTKQAAVSFVPDALCPRWERFLMEIFADCPDMVNFIWKFAGYSITGLTREQVFAFLFGNGRNGKSTFIEPIYGILGEYSGRAGKNLIAKSSNGTNPEHEIAELHGIRLLVACETAEGERLNENVIKDITGGDTLRGCRKYEHAFSFTPQCTMWIYGNYKPDIRGTDDGIWRRVRLIPFLRQFTGADMDPELRDTLDNERTGIFAWLVRGCLEWQNTGLRPLPSEVAEAVKAYREDSDTLKEFIDETVVTDADGSVSKKALYDSYRGWALGEGLRPMSNRTFTSRIKDRGIAGESKSNGDRRWTGIRFQPVKANMTPEELGNPPGAGHLGH